MSYRPGSGTTGEVDLSYVGQVSQAEAEEACRYLPEMQARLDDAVAMAGPIGDYPSPAVYGTYVHQRLKDQIDAMRRSDLHAEVSAYKIAAEAADAVLPIYGYPATIRIDAVEYREDGTVCVYDFKTGKAGMTRQRFLDVGRGGYSSRAAMRRAIVIQVRPSRR
mgnify:CR=1 FL=1